MIKALKLLDDHIETFIASLLLISISIITFIQVIMRYVFSYPLVWSEEIARFAFVWFVYVSASYAVKYQRHVKFSFLVDKTPMGVRLPLQLLAFILWIGFLIFLLIVSFDVNTQLYHSMQKSSANQIPMFIVYLAVPLGALLMTVRVSQHIYKHVIEMNQYFRRQK